MRFYSVARAVGVLTMLLSSVLFSGCGGGSMSQQKESVAKLKQIIIVPPNPQLTKGSTLQLSATGMFDDGIERPLADAPTWQTSAAAVATVDAQGNVTGAGEGVAQISAVSQGVTGGTSVNVGPPALLSITVSPNQATLPVGESEQLTATGNFSDGTVQDLTQSATWSSSASTIASVSAAGVAVANTVGAAAISATAGSVAGSANLTVSPAAVVALNIIPPTLSLSLGNSRQIQAIATLSDGTTQDMTGVSTWKTGQPAIATVNAPGNVASVAQGVALVSAVYQGATASAAVTVGPPALLSITVTPSQSSLPIGESEQFSATGKFSDGSVQNLPPSATWSSSGPAIAAISPSGSAVGKAVGTTTISATSGSVTGSASLTVTPVAVISLNVVPATLSMVLQSSRQLQAIATLSDGTTQDKTGTVEWSSMQPNIAGVNTGGLVSTLQVGSTTILAQSNGVTGSADITVVPLALVNYFNRASAVQSGVDGTVQLVNPGLKPGADVCAMVYVFDQSQELNECCGCSISDSGLRTLSVLHDLTANPLTGTKPRVGEIKIVPSDPSRNPQCDPGSLTPAGAISGWGANPQVSDTNVQVTETPFEVVPLSPSEATFLSNMCSYLEKLGSGRGICSCGTGG